MWDLPVPGGAEFDEVVVALDERDEPYKLQ